MAALAAIACGGDDDDDTSPTNSSAGSASFQAKDAVPDLKSIDFTLAEEQRDPAAPASQDVYRSRYTKPGSSAAVLTALYVFPSEDVSMQQFTALSTALKKPPSGFVGSDADFAGSTSPNVGQQQKGYVTAAADRQGNKVWTDVYRIGRTVAIVQVLEKGEGDQLPLRTSIARAIQDKVPR